MQKTELEIKQGQEEHAVRITLEFFDNLDAITRDLVKASEEVAKLCALRDIAVEKQASLWTRYQVMVNSQKHQIENVRACAHFCGVAVEKERIAGD